MNQTQFIGRLASDPKIYQTEKGKQYCTFSIITDNGKDNEPDYIRCVAWNKQCDLILKHCKKGKQVGITGKLCNYKGNDGKTALQVNVFGITLLADSKIL